jgi:hypothetical protein
MAGGGRAPAGSPTFVVRVPLDLEQRLREVA